MGRIDRELIEQALDILADHRGRENSISTEELNQQLGVGESDSFEGKEVLQYLLYEEGIPIAATRNGYFLIDSKRELHRYVQMLHRSQFRTEKRERAAKRAFDSEFDIERVSAEELAPE
ncbi:hypothetical protein [Halorientalis salina]|uniref:hypothetical protein n=1 Tax=Halorientalis salina TaxID=2932266 RepID=UPI0010AC3D17|nr:hypothetical protein [Halorientalis salina]